MRRKKATADITPTLPTACIKPNEAVTVKQSNDGQWNLIHNANNEVVAIFKDHFVGLVGFHSSATIKKIVETIGQHSASAIDVKDTTLIFPGNEGHHGPSSSLYSHKSGGGLASLASHCYNDLQSATLSFPQTFYKAKGQEKKNIVNGAMYDFWKMVGFGHFVLLPIRKFKSQDTLTTKFFAEPVLSCDKVKYEPSFWGAINTTAEPKLAQFYLTNLKYAVTTLSNSDQGAEVPKTFVKVYNEGREQAVLAEQDRFAWFKPVPKPAIKPQLSSSTSSFGSMGSSGSRFGSSGLNSFGTGSTYSQWGTGSSSTTSLISSRSQYADDRLSRPSSYFDSYSSSMSKIMAYRQGYSSLYTDRTVQAEFKTEDGKTAFELNVTTWHLTNFSSAHESVEQYKERKRQQIKDIVKLLVQAKSAGKPLDALVLQGGDFFHPEDEGNESFLGIKGFRDELHQELEKHDYYPLLPKNYREVKEEGGILVSPIGIIINNKKWQAIGKFNFDSMPKEVVGIILEERNPKAGQVAKKCNIINASFDGRESREGEILFGATKKGFIAEDAYTVLAGFARNGKENELVVIPSQQTYVETVEPYSKNLILKEDQDKKPEQDKQYILDINLEPKKCVSEIGLPWEPATKLLSIYDARIDNTKLEQAKEIVAKMAFTYYYRTNNTSSFENYFAIEDQSYTNLIKFYTAHRDEIKDIDAQQKQRAEELKAQEAAEAQERERLAKEQQEQAKQEQEKRAQAGQKTQETPEQQVERLKAEQERAQMIAEDQEKRAREEALLAEGRRILQGNKLPPKEIKEVVVAEFTSVDEKPKENEQYPDQFHKVRDAEDLATLYQELKNVLEVEYPNLNVAGDEFKQLDEKLQEQLIDLNKKALKAMETIFHNESQKLDELKATMIKFAKLSFLIVPLIILVALAIRYQYQKAHSQIVAYDIKLEGDVNFVLKKTEQFFKEFSTKPIANQDQSNALQKTVRPTYATNSENDRYTRMKTTGLKNFGVFDKDGNTDETPRVRVYFPKGYDRKKDLRALKDNYDLKAQRVL